MKQAFKAAVAAAVLAAATVASATPSTVFWTPATTYTQPFLVPHLTYDTYFSEGGQLQPDYGLTVGILPFDKVQAEVGIDLLVPGLHKDNLYLNGKVTLVEGALADWQPGVSLGIQSVGFKKDYSDYNLLHLTVGKTFGFGTVAVGGYHGGNKVLYTSSRARWSRPASWPRTPARTSRWGSPASTRSSSSPTTPAATTTSAPGASAPPSTSRRPSSLLTGPVMFNDKDLMKASYGSDFIWTVQLDVDFDLRAPHRRPPSLSAGALRGASGPVRPGAPRLSARGRRSGLEHLQHHVDDQHLEPLQVGRRQVDEAGRHPGRAGQRLHVDEAGAAGDGLGRQLSRSDTPTSSPSTGGLASIVENPPVERSSVRVRSRSAPILSSSWSARATRSALRAVSPGLRLSFCAASMARASSSRSAR